MAKYCINGVESSAIDILDRGFQYGDGLFETIRTIKGKPVLWSEHWTRLRNGCERLGIATPDEFDLLEDMAALMSGNTGVAKITVTRGIGPRGYRPPENSVPTRVVQFTEDGSDWINELQEIELITCQTMLSRQPALAGLKHLNRLEQVLAQQECMQKGVIDGVMCDQDGDAIETTYANLFAVSEGQVYTPPITHCGVQGVMRDYLMNIVSVIECQITSDELRQMDELFVSNSVFGVRSVGCLDDVQFMEHDVAEKLFEQLKKDEAI